MVCPLILIPGCPGFAKLFTAERVKVKEGTHPCLTACFIFSTEMISPSTRIAVSVPKTYF